MLVTDSEWSVHDLDSGIADDHLLDGLVAASSRVSFDGFDDVHTVQHLISDLRVAYNLSKIIVHLSKYDMLPVQPGGLHSGDEELRAVGVLASIGHGQPAGALVLQSEVLVLELVAVDGLPTSPSNTNVKPKLDFRQRSDYPSPLVKSPPCSMKLLMTRWKALPLYPSGLVLVASVAKFSTVLGTTSPNSPISMVPSATPPMVMSKKTGMEKEKRKEKEKLEIQTHLSGSPWDQSEHQLCCCSWR